MSVNLKSTYGAVGDTQDVTAVLTIGSGSSALSSSTALWASGDVGKVIGVEGAGSGGGILNTTISGFTNNTHITLGANASTALSAVSKRVVWGTNDTAAFASFTSANAGLSNVVLTIPAGIYTLGQASGVTWGNGVTQWTASGAGPSSTTITNFAMASTGGLDLCSYKGIQTVASPGNWQANIASVAAGSTTVQLLNPALNSIYTVGQYAFLSGIDTQGLWNGGGFGFPPNPYYYEWVLVSAIDTSPVSPTYGQITLSAPLRNSYLSTWPLWDAGGVSGPYEGGPAVLYWVDPKWDTDATFDGLTFDPFGSNGGGAQINCEGRKVTINNCVLKGAGIYPTQHKEFIVTNSDYSQMSDPNGLEIDKMTETVSFTNCQMPLVKVQSPSPNTLTFDTCTLRDVGSPKNLVLNNCTFAAGTLLKFGCEGSGASSSVVATGSTILGTQDTSVTIPVGVHWTMANGIITIPNTDSSGGNVVNSWAIPGSYFFFNGGSFRAARGGKVISVTQDGTNAYIQTNLSGGFPNIPTLTNVKVHPCPSVTFTNCISSDPDVQDIMTAPAGSPVHSHMLRTYAANAASGSLQPSFQVWGLLKSITFNVTKAYTGVRPSLFFQLASSSLPVLTGSNSQTNYLPQIDLLTPGVRTVTPSGATPLGSDSGLTFPSNGWFGVENDGSLFSANISGESSALWPSITVEILTDHGLVPSAVIPLRLRIRA